MRRKKSKFTKAELLNRAIEAWEKRQEGAVIMLRKSAEMLLKLRRQRQRLLARETKALTARDVVWPSGQPVKSGEIEPGSTIEIEVGTGMVTAIEPPKPDKADDDIPGFLDRTNDKDAAARAEIAAEQATQKKRKAERRIAKLKDRPGNQARRANRPAPKDAAERQGRARRDPREVTTP